MSDAKTKTSRVGKVPIEIPKGVTFTIAAGKVSVKGPKGSLTQVMPKGASIKEEDGKLLVTSDLPGRNAPRVQGLARALVANMFEGCSVGYTKILELHGTGYRAELKGRELTCILGFSHHKKYNLPDGIEVEIPKDSKGTKLFIRGADKAVVGQMAATLRSFRPPEPYGGKGVRYQGERVREKAGKAGSK